MADLETLQIRIKADADTAYKAIDKLAISLNNLSVSIGRIETGKLNDLASGLDNVSYALKTAKQAVKTSDYTAIFKNFTKLSNIDTARLNNLAGSLNNLASGFTNMTAANSASAYVKDMAAAIAKLGGVKVEAAVTNIPRLESALAHLLTTFSRIPTINQSVIDFVNSLSNLAAQGSHVGPATQSIEHSLESFGSSATRATRKARSLASVIGTLYAKFWLFARGAKALKNSFVSAADYLEAFNYFDVTARKIGKDTFAKAGVGSAEQYAEAFTKTLQEKLHKMSGLELDLEQRLIKTTNAKSLGLNLTELTQYQASIASITNAMGVSQEVAQSTSKVFSMLAGDIGSLRNMDFSQVSQKLQAGLAGQARALYSFGIDITNATLAEYAYAEGITKSVSEMTQAEKAQLRLLAILDQSKVAWGDLANTINSPSNQLRMLQTNLKEVGTVFGQLFIPIMESALPVINGLALAIKQLMVDIAELLGIKLNLDSFGQFGADIDADIESMDELNKAVKETKKGIREFDELKVIGGNKDAGTGVGDQIDLTKQIIEATNEYEKVWNEAYKRMTSKASEIAAYISGAFEPIKKIIEDFHVGDFFKAGEDVSNLAASLFSFISKAINSIDWETIGTKVGDFIKGIDWVKVLRGLASVLGSAIQASIDLFTGIFNAAPFETAIIAAFGVLKYTGLGKTLVDNVSAAISGKLKKPGLSKEVAGKIGTVSLALGLVLTFDDISAIANGKYLGSDLKSIFKTGAGGLLTGTGLGMIAKALGVATTAGEALALGTAGGLVYIAASLFIKEATMKTPYEAARIVHEAELKWVDEYNLKTVEIQTSIDLRGEITQESIKNIEDLSNKVWDLSQNFDKLTDEEKGQLKRYSDELIELVPGAKELINEMTGAVKATGDEWQRVIDLQKEEIRLNAYRQNLEDVKGAIAEGESTQLQLVKQLEENNANRGEILDQFIQAFGDSEKGREFYEQVLKEIKEGKNPNDFGGAAIGFTLGGVGGHSLIGDLSWEESEKLINSLSDSVAEEDVINKKLKEVGATLQDLDKDYAYWSKHISDEYTEMQRGIVDSTQETIDEAQKIIKDHKLPKAVENTMTKVDNQIKHGDKVSTANMNKMFNSINEAFAGLEDGKPPAEIQAMLDNIKDAIINNSPELELLMAQLAIKMENAFSNALQTDDGHLLWNQSGISKRLDQDFNTFEDALNVGAKPGTQSIEKDLMDLFGVNAIEKLPSKVNKALKAVSDTISKGEGKKAVLDALQDLKDVTVDAAREDGMYLQFGLAGGIYDGRHVLKDAVNEGMVDTAIDTAEEGYEERSPSKVFEKIGKYLPMGAAIGIKDGIPDVKSAIQSMVSVATSAFSNVRYNVPDLGLGSVNAQRGFNYGSMDSNNGFVAQMLNMANTAAQNGQTEVVFRVEGDPYGIFKVVREENDKYRRQHSNRSAF